MLMKKRFAGGIVIGFDSGKFCQPVRIPARELVYRFRDRPFCPSNLENIFVAVPQYVHMGHYCRL